MTIKEKWLKLAEAFATPFKDRSKWQVRATRHGLCNITREMRIPFSSHACVCGKFRTNTKYGSWGFFLPVRESSIAGDGFKPKVHDECRSLFCTLLAETCNERF